MKNSQLLIIVFSLIGLFSCQTRPDFSEQIQQLDTTYEAVENAEQEFLTINFAATSALIKKISDDIEFIEQNYVGEMDRAIAQQISDYLTAKKMVKKFGSRYKKINLELSRTKKQISMLKTALGSNATHDKDGNEFTEEYVNKILGQELKVADQLTEQMVLLAEQDKKAHKRFEEYRDRIDVILSSIPVKVD